MALPTTITGVAFPTQNWYNGPFKSSVGNVYWLGRQSASTQTVSVQKATDPTTSFSEVATWAPNAVAVASMKVAQVSDVLHVILENVPSAKEVYYRQFNMATDAWVAAGETVATGLTGTGAACDLAVLSTGDVVAMFGGTSELIMSTTYERIVYARRSSGVWGAPVAVSPTLVQAFHRGATALLGASDRVHFFWFDYTNSDLRTRSLSSTSVLDTGAAPDTTVATGALFGVAPGVYESTLGLLVPYLDSDSTIAVAKATSGADPTFAFDTAVSGVAVANTSGTPIACLTRDGTNLHLLYSDTATADLWRDINTGSGWGVDTSVLASVTINRITANVYTRSSTNVLAYVYDDAGAVKYGEVSLGVTASPVRRIGKMMVPQ